MNIAKWFYVAAVTTALLVGAAARTVIQKSHIGAPSTASYTEAGLVDDPQRGAPPSRGRPSGPPPAGTHPPSGSHAPSAGRPPSSGHPRSGEHPPIGPQRPEGTTGRVPPPTPHPESARDQHTLDAPVHQRAHPIPGIHGHATPRVVLLRHHYPRPYFVFRPQYWLGYGFYVGYPVPYPWWFGYPDYVFCGGCPLTPPVPSSAAYGGISLTIEPDTAIVVLDGVEVGLARDFSATEQPLTLLPGHHHVELFAPGLQPLAFDVDVIAGQVIPFSGVLQPR